MIKKDEWLMKKLLDVQNEYKNVLKFLLSKNNEFKLLFKVDHFAI